MNLIIAFILLLAPINDLNKVAKANEHKKAAKEAYMEEDYETAAYHYQFLKDSLDINDENVLLNLANSLYKIQDSTSARNLYNDLLEDTSPQTRTQAHQQLGSMDFNGKKYEEALDHYKNALRTDPGNEDARYNYELLKKLIKEQEEQQQNQQNQDEDEQNQDEEQEQKDQQEQQNQDQQNQDQQEQDSEQQEDQENQQQDKEGEEQEQQEQQEENSEEKEQQKPEDGEESEQEPEQQEPTTADKLEEMNISEEKAQMILEAMKNNEIQYLQQNKRKPTKRKKSGKPDW